MAITNIQAAQAGLTPGVLEELNNYASLAANFPLSGAINDAKASRNTLYFGLGLIAIGAIGSAIGNAIRGEEVMIYTGITLATAGVGITTFSGLTFWKKMATLQNIINVIADRSSVGNHRSAPPVIPAAPVTLSEPA
jgi:energy-converting hydrogenase Eha subunit E